MITDKEKKSIKKARQEWTVMYNTMRFSFEVVEKAFHNLPWYKSVSWGIWGKAKMHGLINKNKAVFEMADKEWDAKSFNFFKDEDEEFKRNYEKYMRLLEEKKKIKVVKNGIEHDLVELGKEAFRH